jgi:hypothetical protein
MSASKMNPITVKNNYIIEDVFRVEDDKSLFDIETYCVEDRDKVASALMEAGFELDLTFSIALRGACTNTLSMCSPREGDIPPEDEAISRCGSEIGLGSLAPIYGNSGNGLMGKFLTMCNGFSSRDWYMARINNPFGEGTVYIPIFVKQQFVDNKIVCTTVYKSEMPYLYIS